MTRPHPSMPRRSPRILWLSMIVFCAILLAPNLAVQADDVSLRTFASTLGARGSTPPPGSTSITVMTLNLGDGLAAADDLVTYIREIDADLVGLQEVTPEIAGALASDLVDILPHQVMRGLGIPGKALLSRYPITQSAWLELNPGRPDLLATVDLVGQPIEVLVAHPPPPELNGGIVQPREGTLEQFDQIVAIAAAAQHPFLLMGDLNEIAMQSRHDDLTSIGLRDVFAEVGTGDGDTYPNRVPPLPDFLILPVVRIDYIWASEEWLPISAYVGEDIGSDHLPVIAQLALADEQDPNGASANDEATFVVD